MIPRAESVAFDYRSQYANADDIIQKGFKRAILSWRGCEAKTASVRAALRAADIRVGYNTEPFLRDFGNPQYEIDALREALAIHYGAILRNEDNTLAYVGREWGWQNALCLDFSDLDFAAALAKLMRERDPESCLTYVDYGYFFGGIGWTAGLERIPAETWIEWDKGYRLYASMLGTSGIPRAIGATKKWDPRAETYGEHFIIEGVELDNRPSRPLFTYAQAFDIARTARSRNKTPLIFCLNSDARHRRILGTIAVMTGAWFSHRWRDLGEVWVNRIARELTIDIGRIDALPTVSAASPLVSLTHGTQGVAILNLSGAPFVWRRSGHKFTVPAMDGLVAATTDVTGKGIEPITNLG